MCKLRIDTAIGINIDVRVDIIIGIDRGSMLRAGEQQLLRNIWVRHVGILKRTKAYPLFRGKTTGGLRKN